MIRTLALCLALTGCATYSGPVADGVSTQIALSNGAVEANPLINSHPGAVVFSVVLRSVYINAMREQRNCVSNVGIMNGAGWGLAVSNLLAAATVTPLVALPVGVVAGVASAKLTEDQRREWCYPTYPSCSLADLPAGAKAATCYKGEIVARY